MEKETQTEVERRNTRYGCMETERAEAVPAVKGDVIDNYTLDLSLDEADTSESAAETNVTEITETAITIVVTSIEEVIDAYEKAPLNLVLDAKGHPQDSFANYVVFIEKDPYLKGKIRYNALNGRPEISDVFWEKNTHTLRDVDVDNIRLLSSTLYDIDRRSSVREAISLVAQKNAYNPVVEALDSLHWDGEPRIGELMPRFLGAERSEYTTAVTLLLLTGAIMRVKEPGIKFDLCIILADTRQGTGKSSMCRMLALEDTWFTDALKDLGNDKTSFEVIIGHWIVELGEMLATKKARTIEDIKSYISRQKETYRMPYSVYAEDYPRQCIFIGTTNKPQFLPDDSTGNRRFIPLICNGSQAEHHPLENEQETREYIRQCYAEAMVLIQENGPLLTLDRRFDSTISDIREKATPENVKVGMIQAWLDSTTESIVCTQMIWDNALEEAYGRANTFLLQEVADIMNLRIVGWTSYHGKDGTAKGNKFRFKDENRKYGQQRAWIKIQDNNGFMKYPEDISLPFD